MLRPGDAAPDFVLKDSEGHDVRLSTYSGRPIILYFYPRDNNMASVVQAKSFRDVFSEIKTFDAAVVGVSMDHDHQPFRDRYEIPFPLLSDRDGRVHDLYDAWRTTLLGKRPIAVRPCTYLIDRDGIIRRAYAHINLLGHGRTVLKDLDRLSAQREWGKKIDPRLKDLEP